MEGGKRQQQPGEPGEMGEMWVGGIAAAAGGKKFEQWKAGRKEGEAAEGV